MDGPARGERFRFGEFDLDVPGLRLRRGDHDVSLQPQVFATLVHLVANADRTVTKDELLSTLWPDAVVGEAALTRCVREIRQALGDDAKSPRFVKTVARVGFRFVAAVVTVGGANGSAGAGHMIAVLPFRPVHVDDRDESLELGMAETLITRLSGLRGLVVRSLSTVRTYAGPDRDPLDAGRMLTVDAVVDGSLQRVGDRLRVTVRLLAVPSGAALVAEQFEESFDDVFEVQDAICRRIAHAVSVEVNAQEPLLHAERETENPDAYAHFLRGRLALGSLMPDGAERSMAHFERALECDPGYASALASQGEAWIIRAHAAVDPVESYAEARRAAEAALALDERLGAAWGCLGTVAFHHDWNWAEAERCFERAVMLSPEWVEFWCLYSTFRSFTGRRDEGVALARRALEADPASPMAGAFLAQALYLAHRPDEGIAIAEATLARAPGFPFALLVIGLACLAEGRTSEAVEWLEQGSGARPDIFGVLAHAYIRAGREEQAAPIEAALSQAVEHGIAPAFVLVPIHAARGDADRLFGDFEESFAKRQWTALLLPNDPLFAPFRADPRAQAMIERLALPAPAGRSDG